MINNLPSFNKIAFLGIGKANEFALNTYNSFPNTESTLLYNQDFICQRNIVMELNKNDLAILFCTNEEDEEYMLNLLDILKSNHVITIGFSYNSNSLFSKSVTYSLTTDLDINSKFSKDLANEIYILLLTRYMYINCFS
jgi:DNA-binding MurR/RpiR family transcriptional regulator